MLLFVRFSVKFTAVRIYILRQLFTSTESLFPNLNNVAAYKNRFPGRKIFPKFEEKKIIEINRLRRCIIALSAAIHFSKSF